MQHEQTLTEAFEAALRDRLGVLTSTRRLPEGILVGSTVTIGAGEVVQILIRKTSDAYVLAPANFFGMWMTLRLADSRIGGFDQKEAAATVARTFAAIAREAGIETDPLSPYKVRIPVAELDDKDVADRIAGEIARLQTVMLRTEGALICRRADGADRILDSLLEATAFSDWFLSADPAIKDIVRQQIAIGLENAAYPAEPPAQAVSATPRP